MGGWLLAGLIACYSGDALTSVAATHAGYHEALLPAQSPAGVVGILGAQALVTYFIYRGINPKHPKAAKWFYAIAVTPHAIGAVWNLHFLLR